MKKIMFNDKYGLTNAVLEGRKTQTRRIIKCPKTYKGTYVSGFRVCRRVDGTLIDTWFVDEHEREIDGSFLKPAYKIGEEVAIAQSYFETIGQTSRLLALAGAKNKMFVKAEYMPHRIKITNVRIERLQDISDYECLKEGIEFANGGYYTNYNKATNSRIWIGNTAKEAFAALIDKVSGKGTWDSNPWVFVYDFELVK